MPAQNTLKTRTLSVYRLSDVLYALFRRYANVQCSPFSVYITCELVGKKDSQNGWLFRSVYTHNVKLETHKERARSWRQQLQLILLSNEITFKLL